MTLRDRQESRVLLVCCFPFSRTIRFTKLGEIQSVNSVMIRIDTSYMMNTYIGNRRNQNVRKFNGKSNLSLLSYPA